MTIQSAVRHLDHSDTQCFIISNLCYNSTKHAFCVISGFPSYRIRLISKYLIQICLRVTYNPKFGSKVRFLGRVINMCITTPIRIIRSLEAISLMKDHKDIVLYFHMRIIIFFFAPILLWYQTHFSGRYWISVSRDYPTLPYLTIRHTLTVGVSNLSCLEHTEQLTSVTEIVALRNLTVSTWVQLWVLLPDDNFLYDQPILSRMTDAYI